MLTLSKQDTYNASEYEIIRTFPTKTDKATKFLCGHGDSWKDNLTHRCPQMAVWAQLCQQQQLYAANSNTPPDFPSSSQIQSHHRGTSQGMNPSSQSSDSTGKVTGIRINHAKLWKTAKMLTYQCHWLYLSLSAVDFSLLLFLETVVSPS